jgi:hypothetical protein
VQRVLASQEAAPQAGPAAHTLLATSPDVLGNALDAGLAGPDPPPCQHVILS